MKDKNGIEICCENCVRKMLCSNLGNDQSYCFVSPIPSYAMVPMENEFSVSVSAYEERIAELQKELNIVQDSERAEAQEADRLRAKVKELGKKLTETIKLLGERSRECGELEAHNEVLQRRVQEFSMELLDRTMKENRDVLERLKEAESDEK